MSKQDVGKGAAYVYIETVISMISGYVFWFVMAKITTSEIIGISSTIVSLATIFITIVTIGIPNGVQRFLGKSFFEQKIEDAKVFVKASLFLITVGIVVCSSVILFAQNWFFTTFGIDFNLVAIAVLLMASSAITTLFRSIIIATLKTKMLPIIMIIASTAKLGLAIALVLIGTGALGLTVGYTFNQILASIILTATLVTILKSSKKKSELLFMGSSKNILIASVASWIPALITTVGSQLGTVVVFGSQGASQAGVFFMAFSIFTAITGVMYSLFTISYPALSAMSDGRKRFASRIIKMSLIIALPFSSSLIFYSKNVMQLFGEQYITGSSSLEILLISMLPIAIITGINTLVYAYGNYRQVLTIGLASSVPRTALYFLLVPLYSGLGAAISYTVGSIIGLIATIIIGRQIGMRIYWKDLALILFIPIGIAFALHVLEVHYIAGILITTFVSYIIFVKLGVIIRQDLEDSLGILPNRIANPLLSTFHAIAKKLNRSY